jgi:hypothetical protein
VVVPCRVFASEGICPDGTRLDAMRFPSHVIEAFSFLAFLDGDRRGYFQFSVPRRESITTPLFLLTGHSRAFLDGSSPLCGAAWGTMRYQMVVVIL